VQCAERNEQSRWQESYVQTSCEKTDLDQVVVFTFSCDRQVGTPGQAFTKVDERAEVQIDPATMSDF